MHRRTPWPAPDSARRNSTRPSRADPRSASRAARSGVPSHASRAPVSPLAGARARARVALRVSALALLALLVGCPKPPTHVGAHLSLLPSLVSAAFEPLPGAEPHVAPPAAIEGLELELPRAGVARVSLLLTPATGIELAPAPERKLVWRLPWLPHRAAFEAGDQPALVGLDLPRVVLGTGPLDVARGGYWLHPERGELVVGLPPGTGLPASFRLEYSVPAALLASAEPFRDVTPDRLLRTRRADGGRLVESIELAGGSKVALTLPAFEAGRLLTRVAATRGVAAVAAGAPARVAIRLGGRELWSAELQVGGDEPRIEVLLDARRSTSRLELEVDASPGVLVCFEDPVISRTRRHDDPPNAMLVLIDTLRADRLGMHGERTGLTPHLDRFAKSSLAFGSTWSTSSWTLPSIASILTSTHTGQHQAWLDDRRLGPGLDTVAEAFARAGYRTAAFTDGGFVSAEFGLDRGFATFDQRGGGVAPVLERASEWLESAGEGPWFVLVHTYEVHAPYEPPEDAKKRVMKQHRAALAGHAPSPHEFYALATDAPDRVPAIGAALEALYDEEVRYLDAELGSFFELMEERGRFSGAAIAITSDHGEEFGEHGLFGHGDTLYEEQLHVPFLLHLPRERRRGEVVWQPTSLVDLAPTLLDAVGLSGGGSGTTFVGVSLLTGTEPTRPYAVRNNARTGLLQALRSGNQVAIDGAYFHSRKETGFELYELASDPLQQKNLAVDNEREAKRLKQALDICEQRFGQPLAEAAGAAPDAVMRNELERLGYLGTSD